MVIKSAYEHQLLNSIFWLRFIFFSWEKAVPSSAGRRRRAWSESDDDEVLDRKPQSSPVHGNSAEIQESDGEIREEAEKQYGDAAVEDDDWFWRILTL